MIYAYFDSKDGLFDAVVAASVDELLDNVPLDTDDLPGYAGKLFDFLLAHPDRRRLTLWRLLEQPRPTQAEIRSTKAKVRKLADARADDQALDAQSLLAFVMAIVHAWPNAAPALGANSLSVAKQRAAVVEAVRRLVTT
jgi:AcrR family transcriptional regulator